jgi:hypothetical protein
VAAALTLNPTYLQVEPGVPATCQITVRNTGVVVDAYRCLALGAAAPWVTFEPETLSLYPGAESTVVATCLLPREPGVPTGSVPFGVQVVSNEDPEGSVVEEGMLDISPYAELGAELTPRTSRGRRRGQHELVIDNRGSVPVVAHISGSDNDDALRFALSPASVQVPPGGVVPVEVEVRPVRRFWRGPDRTRPFMLVVESDQAPPVPVSGTLLQMSRVPKWLLAALGIALLSLAALAVLWIAVLRPQIRSDAKTAAEDAVDQKLAPALAAQDKINADLAKKVGASAPSPVASLSTAPPAGGLAGAPSDYAPLGAAFTLRLEATGGSPNPSYTVPAGKTFSLTDIVLGNPEGDAGLVRIRRAGQPLLTIRLDNFRDNDFHFVAPIVFTAGQTLQMAVQCQNPNPPGNACTPGGLFTGYLK